MAALTLTRTWTHSHSSIWLKAIRAVNTDRHCINCLIGKRVPLQQVAYAETIELPVAPAYYLCGVVDPTEWRANTHVLAFAAFGEHHVLSTPGLEIALTDLATVRIQADWITEPERYAGDRAYLTCRNLQAAHYLRDRCGLPDRAPARLF